MEGSQSVRAGHIHNEQIFHKLIKPWRHPLEKKKRLPLFRRSHLQIVCCLWVGLYAGILSGLNSNRSCACFHRSCESIPAVGLFYLEDTVSQESSATPYNLAASSSAQNLEYRGVVFCVLFVVVVVFCWFGRERKKREGRREDRG